MRQKSIRPDNTEFVILSFEGPDGYSLAGGLGVRVNHLSTTLARMGFPTHLFFVGDPHLPGEQRRCRKKLVLHRWCQWISEYYPDGVYHGEEDKVRDFNQSIPPFVTERIVKPAVDSGKLVVVLGEEWHTAEAMCRLSDALHWAGLRDRVVMFWNANNTFSFHRIDWARLSYATTATTVSRYMKHVMRRMGVNPLVIPNGIPKSLLETVDLKEVRDVRNALNADLLMCKVARWDPDKCWNEAVAATAQLKDKGLNPMLLARGGIESHGQEVLSRAHSLGLVVNEATMKRGSPRGYLAALQESTPADVVDIRFHMPQEFLRLLYRASDCVLANSGHEPFGLVGLEAMAAGGIVFAGCTGEDYAIPFVNAFVLETADPEEIVGYITYLREYPEEVVRMRKAARRTARLFTWEAATQNLIGRVENQARVQHILRGKPVAEESPFVVPRLTNIVVASTKDIPVDDRSVCDTLPQTGEREMAAVA
ncbi:MAG: glycosyltransferase [Chloroflexota bacterium]|nr:glycosyltransferase [Chloroflexota bacterium]